jgi:hypothetical protein
MTEQPNLPALIGYDTDDVFDSDRLIQGAVIKCVDGHWSSRDGVSFPVDTKMLAMGTAIAVQCWKDQKPIDTILKQPGEPLPDVDELNAKIAHSDWELGLDGKPRPPWIKQFIVYLLDPADAALFTFINGTVGAEIAVDRLKSKVAWMRQLRGSNVVPLIKLDSKPMKTRFGQKKRPEFTVLEWRQLGGGGLKDVSPARVEHRSQPYPDDCAGLAPVEPVSIEEEMNDEIPL